MLTIKNIDNIRGALLIIRGIRFKIVDVANTNYEYKFGIWCEQGTSHAPMVLTICREAETFDMGEVKKYVMRKDGLYPHYVSKEILMSTNKFILHVTNFLNNLG